MVAGRLLFKCPVSPDPTEVRGEVVGVVLQGGDLHEGHPSSERGLCRVFSGSDLTSRRDRGGREVSVRNGVRLLVSSGWKLNHNRSQKWLGLPLGFFFCVDQYGGTSFLDWCYGPRENRKRGVVRVGGSLEGTGPSDHGTSLFLPRTNLLVTESR